MPGNVAENWRRLKRNYDIYIVAAGLSRKTKKERSCILLNLVGEDTVERYNSFTFEEGEDRDDPDDPDVLKQKFEELCMLLKKLTFERHLFHIRKQGWSESINSLVTDLKNIARKCEFGDLERDLIKERIVAGFKQRGKKNPSSRNGFNVGKSPQYLQFKRTVRTASERPHRKRRRPCSQRAKS